MGIKELFKKMHDDKDFAQKYKGLNLEAWVEQAKKDGCNITKEDLLAYRVQRQSAELSESELSMVNGGEFYIPDEYLGPEYDEDWKIIGKYTNCPW